MDDLSGFVSYDMLAHAPLARRGWSVDEVPWRREGTAWGDYDVVVIRTTWDYQNHADEFLRTLDSIAAATRLENDVHTVRWNLRKRYLRELAARGARVVPTIWLDSPGEDELRAALATFDTAEIVVKPEVGANADDAVRLRADADPAAFAAAVRVFRDRACLAQPFIPAILSEGEFSLIFFDGRYSHAILKTPKPADFRVQEEHGGIIRSAEPEPALLAEAHAVLDAARAAIGSAAIGSAADAAGGQRRAPLYARADLVRMPDDGFALMELELIEPSLYLSYDAGAADRFAAAIDERRP
jgi:hypothetical protein